MEKIYSSAALKMKQREVKDAALKDIVHITENGNGAFIFCSEEVFARKMEQAAAEAVRAERERLASCASDLSDEALSSAPAVAAVQAIAPEPEVAPEPEAAKRKKPQNMPDENQASLF